MSINTKKKSHGFHLPLLLCLLFAFATFPVYSQQDLKTIRKDNKADKERLEKYADKKSQEIKQEEEMLRQMAEDSNKHILEAVEKKYYNEILKDLRDSVYQWQEKDEFEKTEDWITRLNKYSSEVFANYCNNKLSAIIAAPYERSAIIVSQYYYDYYKHNDYQSVSPIIIGNPYEIRLSEYDADKELFILAIFFDVQVRYEHFYTKYRTWDNKYFIDSDWKDTALYSFEHFFKLKKSISDAKLFKSKMETKVGIGIEYMLKNYFYNYCICVPLEPSNYCFYHHRPIPKIIEFYDFEIDNLLVIRHFDYYEDIEWTPKYRLNKLDSIKRLNPWGAPKYVINVLENIDTNEIEDIIIYFDDLGIENPYLKGSYYNYTKQKFYQNPETAKLIAEEEARLQKIKAEQEQKRINDSIFQQADSILQSAIEDYHRYLKQLPYDTIENRIALSLPDSLNGKNQKLSETLNWLLDTVQSKKAEIATRYTNDSIIFSKYNDKLHKLTETANARLLAYPYNLQQRTITDELPINLFGKEEELEKALQT